MILLKCLGECQDYFARLGGSARYETYREWHSPCLVLMTLLEIHHSEEFTRRKIVELDLPERLWRSTYGLPTTIKGLMIDKPVTQEMISEFVKYVADRLKQKSDAKEFNAWTNFSDSIEADLKNIK